MARGLSVEKVVAAAIALADEEGLAAVTMARVAERVGFTTMSLYRHVASKEELVRLMLDSVLGLPPEFPMPDWRAGLEGWARALLALLDEHPWGIDVPITGMLGTTAQLAWLDRGLEALADTGLDEDEKAGVVLLVNGYVFWAARLRFQVPERFEGPVVPPEFDLAGLPWLQRAVAAGIFEGGDSQEDGFAFGLDLVLDGIETLVARRA